MQTTTAILLAFVAVAAATGVSGKDYIKQVEKDNLIKQKNILDLLIRVHHPSIIKEILDIAHSYDLEEHVNDYKDPKVAKELLTMWREGLLLPHDEIFVALDESRRPELILMIKLLMGAKDYDTFYKTACSMHEYVNKGQFVTAFYIAVLQREDTRDIILPPLYELYPFGMFPSEVIQQAQDAQMRGAAQHLVIHVNNSACHGNVLCFSNREQKLAYFREDIGLGDFHGLWHFTQGSIVDMERRGELFLYVQQQLLARYNLERMSNEMEETPSIRSVFNTLSGYTPNIRFHNGKEMTTRPAGLRVADVDRCTNKEVCNGKGYYSVGDIIFAEQRLLDAIDTGYVITADHKKVSFRSEANFSYLGDLLIDAPSSNVDRDIYMHLYTGMLALLGRVADPKGSLGLAPSAMESYFTAVRDPLYYSMLKRVLESVANRFKQKLPKYTHEELQFPGVKIDSVEIDKLVTYFEKYEVDLDNAVSIGKIEDGEHVDIRAHVDRINHKPFTYIVKATSEQETNALVRVFLGPKYDTVGRVLNAEKMRKNMVEIDRFPTKLQAGENTIERKSQDSTVISKDKISTRTLQKKVLQAIQGGEAFTIDKRERQCGFPERLLIPKGKVSGMPFTFFVMISPYEDNQAQDLKTFDLKSVSYCGINKGMSYTDTKAMGYPFDRPIRSVDFHTANMYFKDVHIFHKKSENIVAEN